MVLSMTLRTANWINRAQDGSNYRSGMTMQGRYFHYIDTLIAHQETRHSFASVYVHDIDDVGGRLSDVVWLVSI